MGDTGADEIMAGVHATSGQAGLDQRGSGLDDGDIDDIQW